MSLKCQDPDCNGTLTVDISPENYLVNTDILFCVRCGKRYFRHKSGLRGLIEVE